jgi:hypothetical protein
MKKGKYKINRGIVANIEAFKNFIGEDKFTQILSGNSTIDIPLDEENYVKFMYIVLDEEPEGGYKNIPYHDAEEILSFFCSPFAGRLLKQAQSTLAGISLLLSTAGPELMKTGLGLTSSPMESGSILNPSNLQTETSERVN